MRAPQVVTPCAASDPAGLAALADAVSLAGWPRDLDQFFAGLDVTAQPRPGTKPAGPAQDGYRLYPHAKKGTRVPCEAPPVTGTSHRGERAGTSRAALTRPGTSAAGTGGVGITTGGIVEDGQPPELRTLFEDAAAGLKLDEREVIELQLRQGLAAGEVAAVLGVSGKHAHLLLSRARSDLESCLGVLLVGRAGRDECGDLAALLTGWDGRLTAVLRKRVQRHIEHCTTCTARRAQELRPSMLRNLSPAAALAAGAAESFRLALGAPAALRAHTMALALGRGPGAGEHSTVVLARTGSFGRRGFPRPARAALAGLASGTPGAAVPGRRAGRTAQSSPIVNGYRHLRSWIESHRLR